MNLSVAEIFSILLAAGVRRRRLIVIPIVIFSILAVVAACIWPRMYAARTLLMLQERQAADPLSSGGASREGRLRGDEVDTLLKSDRVLTSAILDFNVGKKPLTAQQLESAIKDLRRQIGVTVVGSEFLEIELKQSDRDGLGGRLAIILTRFFERLLSREDSMKTARRFALEQRKRDVDVAKAAIEDWVKRAVAAGAKEDAGSGGLLEMQAERKTAEDNLLAAARSALPEAANLTTMGETLADELRLASAHLRGPGGGTTASQQVGMLRDLETQHDAYWALSASYWKALTAHARAVAQTLPRQQDGQTGPTEALLQEWHGLDSRFAEALQQFDSQQKGSRNSSGPTLTPFGLIAPDSIRIIDEPRDPILPTTSPLKIIVAFFVGGIGLGIGLAAIAEQFDDRVYDSRAIEQIVGAENVVRISTIADEGILQDDPADSPLRRRGHLAVVSEA